MYELELHKIRHAELIRRADNQRLIREARRAGRAVRRSARKERERMVNAARERERFTHAA
ncbi:hypothetical protein [Streptomyces brevispora]|uniref:Uncharacterized protein n=1 Tax=Streptomyces brevispora TaxID=887462 RepID=A0A561V2N6_9ACTN|nr:hypothetical protein [Streptomyces brevispora]TWG05843.1 hypothetical protein FHX80_114325 [Streptomyces brevispora]WSC13161.1 hypothetical protein OIE64_10160 [Streptomyces brevispora]